MITSNTILIDTNVLVYATDKTSPFYQNSKNIRDKGVKGDISLCLCPQILNEFYAVVTNPKRVENPRTPNDAINEIEKYLNAENIINISPTENIMQKMIELLRFYQIRKQEIFDLFLVATMLCNGVNQIYTYNVKHFALFKEIKTLTP